jgi:hypothetical protein
MVTLGFCPQANENCHNAADSDGQGRPFWCKNEPVGSAVDSQQWLYESRGKHIRAPSSSSSASSPKTETVAP